MTIMRGLYCIFLFFVVSISACDESAVEPKSETVKLAILYEYFNGGWSTTTISRISISEDGIFMSHTEHLSSGMIYDEITGYLSEGEMRELKIFVIFKNRFFRLPENVTGTECRDCGYSRIEVRYGDRAHRVGGRMIKNEQYLNISRKLHEIKDRFDTQDEL